MWMSKDESAALSLHHTRVRIHRQVPSTPKIRAVNVSNSGSLQIHRKVLGDRAMKRVNGIQTSSFFLADCKITTTNSHI